MIEGKQNPQVSMVKGFGRFTMDLFIHSQDFRPKLVMRCLTKLIEYEKLVVNLIAKFTRKAQKPECSWTLGMHAVDRILIPSLINK